MKACLIRLYPHDRTYLYARCANVMLILTPLKYPVMLKRIWCVFGMEHPLATLRAEQLPELRLAEGHVQRKSWNFVAELQFNTCSS